MNLALVDPFILAQDIPDALTGRINGTLVIFDVETNGVARKLRGHTRQIQSLSWSNDGRYLLSSGQDCKSILWDLSNGERLRTVRFEAPIYIAELHPYNHLLFVAALFDDHPVLVDISSSIPIKHTIPTAPKRALSENEEVSEKQAAQDAKQTTCVTIFNAMGSHIITGTSRGWINIINVESRSVISSTRMSTGVILLLRLSPSGRDLVCNATDRIIRTLQLPDLSLMGQSSDSSTLEVEHKFQDVVQRLSWNHATFSSTGEYVAATTYMTHDIYLWERGHGSLVKILECQREELGIVEWHPQRPLIAACGLETGKIYLWSIITPQRWSALAPDFVEVEENVEYIEREDEFDIHPIEEIHKRRLDLEDEAVDVLTVEPTKNDFEEDVFSMPVLLDVGNSESEDEMVEVGRGVMRRKSPGEGKQWMDGTGSGASADERGAGKVINGQSKKIRKR
ncbi:uncharacterized protein KY384_001555 [Bacidia gigantensis]|uniref:uncharacterized protein n=1 Tax=Bacidia gigantensis TaxID=2732470 RepID=UPI001D037526|nr:uncharacterized protein KY384_001555 [Bacidia gigantensis]KAG8533814.1 hypothetical protein KY384_001555 [Bacidia gigantensis]